MPKRKYEPRPQCRTCPYVEKRDEYEWFCEKDDRDETIFLGWYRRRPSWCPIAREREEKRLSEDSVTAHGEAKSNE